MAAYGTPPPVNRSNRPTFLPPTIDYSQFTQACYHSHLVQQSFTTAPPVFSQQQPRNPNDRQTETMLLSSGMTHVS